MPPAEAPSPLHVMSRVAASLLGSYVFVWGLSALGIALGVATGMPYEDAQTWLYLLAFLLYLACFCWAISARSLLKVWAVLACGGGALTAAAWFLGRALV
jgi:hypothetical protein